MRADFEGTDRFEIVRVLGKGGMGTVYEAVDHKRGARVALKALNLPLPELVVRLKREFRALQGVQHPNLVSFLELVEHEGELFFTMELIEGGTLYDYVRGVVRGDEAAPADVGALDTIEADGIPADLAAAPSGPARAASALFDESRLRDAMGQLAQGLVALHESHTVHRDVKPSNVLVASDGRVVILDFGLAVDAAAAPEWSGASLVGTIAYMAPEQAASKPVGPEADWYSVGVMLYEALTGRLPFDGSPYEIMLAKQRGQPPAPSELVAGVPVDLDRLCVKLLAFDPAERPSTKRILGVLGVATSTERVTWTTASDVLPFVGRTAELAVLQAAFEQVRGGSPMTVVVRGDSGMGKTVLVDRFVDSLDGDTLVLRGRCYERESVPYKALDDVVDGLVSHLRTLSPGVVLGLMPEKWAVLVDVFPALRRVPALRDTGAPAGYLDLPERRNQLFGAFRALLSNLSAQWPLVIALDDMQWADVDSAALLTEVMREPGAPRSLTVPIVRDARWLGRRLSEYRGIVGTVQVVEVGALAPDAAIDLARRLLAGVPGGAGVDADALVAEAGGHPLFIDELVRHTALTGATTGPDLRLDDALWQRIRELARPEAEVLQLVAVAGAPIAREIVAAASGQDYGDFSRHTGVLRIARLVQSAAQRDEEFLEAYHSRVRDIVLDRLSAERKLALHERLASALETSPHANERPELVMRHLAEAGDNGRAARYALLGAKRANDALAFERAAKLYRFARKHGEHTPEARRAIDIALADALRNAGHGQRAASAYLRAARGADPSTRRDCHRQAAEQLLVTGHIRRGLTVLRALLSEMGTPFPESPRRAFASLVWHRLQLALRGYKWKERDVSDLRASDLARADAFQAVGTGLGAVDHVRGADFQARALLAALRLGEPTRVARALAVEAIFVGVRGGRHLRKAYEFAREARRIGEQRDDETIIALSTGIEGLLLYFDSEFRQAFDLFRQAEPRFRSSPSGSTFELNNLRLMGLFSMRHMGRFNEWRQLYDRFVRDAQRRGDRFAETSLRRTGNMLYLAADRMEQAERNLAGSTWSSADGGFHLQHWYELEARGEMALYQDSAAEQLEDLGVSMRALRGSLLPRIQNLDVMSEWLWGKLHVAAALRGYEKASCLAIAAKCARRLERIDSRLAEVTATGLRAALVFQTGDKVATVAALRAAEQAARRLDMSLVAAAALHHRGEMVGGADGAEMLARAEAWMTSVGIVVPAKMRNVALPGFA